MVFIEFRSIIYAGVFLNDIHFYFNNFYQSGKVNAT
jgi:hypothetical protein